MTVSRPADAGWSRLVAVGLAVVVGVTTAVATAVVTTSPAESASPATQTIPPGGMTAEAVATMFREYGDAGGHWTGGDGTVSVALPDGRVAWLFSDTFLGTVNSDGTRPRDTPMVNNTILVQDGTTLVDTLHGGAVAMPGSLVVPEQPGEFFWLADAVVESGVMKVLYNRYARYGGGGLDVELTGTSLVAFALPALTVSSVVDLPVGRATAWGSALLVDGPHTYVYGTSSGLGGLKFGHVARAPAGDLGGVWQFWTGSEWSGSESDAARLLSGVGTAYAVQKVGDQYVLVTQENNALFDPQIVAYTATAPTGPWSGPAQLLTAPEQEPGSQKIVYHARLHPDLARPSKLLLSYDVNSLDPDDNYADARLYRPRFEELDWPPPQPGPGAPPAAPSGFTVTTDAAGVAHLSWSAVTGATGYRVHRRDVTGGQTHFVRQWQPVTSTSTDVNGLITGHEYEFLVTAANQAGEGPFSTTVTASPRTADDSSVIRASDAPDSIPESYVVRFKDTPAVRGAGVEAVAGELLAQAGGGTIDRLFPRTLRGFAATLTEEQAILLAGHPDVLDVEQDQAIMSQAQQLNPPWGLDRIDQRDVQLDQRYTYPNTGGGVHLYVVDSGIRISHQTFGNRASYGIDTVSPVPPGSPPNTNAHDCNGHGTHVAGTAGGAGYGVAKGVELVAVKVFDCNGRATSTSVLEGVEWVIDNAQAPAVVNLSLGQRIRWWRAGEPTDLEVAVQVAIDSGITVVAAAGNWGADACNTSPARLPEVITVGNVDRSDSRNLSSNYGECLDLFAPGTDIVSASFGSDSGASTKTGTSMAAPHVAGAAAMVLAAHPGYSPAQVERVLVGAATSGVVQNGGTGSPDRLLFVEQPPTQAPMHLFAGANPDGTIGLGWDAVAEPDVHYLVTQRDVTANEGFTVWRNPVFDGTTATAVNLKEGHTYEFKVQASTSMGVGPDSNIASAIAHTEAPDAPTDLTATANADGTITLEWAEPAPGLWYWVYQRDQSAGEDEFIKLPLPVTTCCTMTAGYLVHGHEYEYKVTAINVGGEGPGSNLAGARSDYPTPEPPENLAASAGDGQVTLTWAPSPTPNVWYWVYQRNVSAREGDFTKLPLPVTACCTMTPGWLTNNDEYEFKVTAIGAGGESAESNVVRARPQRPVPAKITGLRATPNADDGTITLEWDLPPGGPFWYEIYQRDVSAGEGFSKLPWPLTTCCTFTASVLIHNHVYEFKVGAISDQAGPLSDPAQATSWYSLPGAPAHLVGRTAGDGTVGLTWTPPGPGGFYYWVYYRDVTAGQGGFTKSGYPTDKAWASIGPLVHGHQYEFKVTAANQGGEGPASTPVRVTSSGGLPQPPSGLTAAAGDGQVTLRWTASPSPNVWYWIDYRPVGGAWQSNLIETCCAFTLRYLTNGTTYEFKMRATNASGNSASSNVVTARPLPPLPQPPTGLSATAGDGRVTLRWTASSTPNVYYWLEHRANGGAWQRTVYPITTCCTHVVSYLLNGTTYEFRLRSTNLAGDSASSNVASARPMPPLPQPPTNLVATAGDGKVTLRWNASPSTNVWYWIEYRPSGGTWQRLAYPFTGCCAFTVDYLRNGVTHYFRVRATNLAGDSAPSNEVSARPMPPEGFCYASAWAPFPDGYPHNAFVITQAFVSCTGVVFGATASLHMFTKRYWWWVPDPFSTVLSWGTVSDYRSGYLRLSWLPLPTGCLSHFAEATVRYYDIHGRVQEYKSTSRTVRFDALGNPC